MLHLKISRKISGKKVDGEKKKKRYFHYINKCISRNAQKLKLERNIIVLFYRCYVKFCIENRETGIARTNSSICMNRIVSAQRKFMTFCYDVYRKLVMVKKLSACFNRFECKFRRIS